MSHGSRRFWLAALPALFVLASFGAQACLAADEGAPTAAGDKGVMMLAAAIVVGASCLAAAIAVARVGAAALGAASERPELLMRSLIFVALAEGIAVLGLIMGIMLWTIIPK